MLMLTSMLADDDCAGIDCVPDEDEAGLAGMLMLMLMLILMLMLSDEDCAGIDSIAVLNATGTREVLVLMPPLSPELVLMPLTRVVQEVE